MPTNEQIVELPIESLVRGFYQPRDYFDAEAMESTKRSIQEKGQKYPVIVRPIAKGNPLFDPSWKETHYELADGERRYRCCKELGFKVIKALIRDLGDEEMLDYTLTTNDSLALNPIEKAQVFSRLAKEFGKSQAEIAKSFNLKQQQVSEFIRLLELPKEVQDLTARAVISVRHARGLLKVSDQDSMRNLALEVEKKSISTRELVKLVKNDNLAAKKVEVVPNNERESIHFSDISFENGGKVAVAETWNVDESLSGVLIEENGLERQQVLQKTHVSWSILGLIDALNGILIPKKLYFRMELWLNMELGSRDRPERWLTKLEMSLLGGLLLSASLLWLPQVIGIPLVAILGTFMVYLFLF
jgi:ParB family chromosome partitioning protein